MNYAFMAHYQQCPVHFTLRGLEAATIRTRCGLSGPPGSTNSAACRQIAER